MFISRPALLIYWAQYQSKMRGTLCADREPHLLRREYPQGFSRETEVVLFFSFVGTGTYPLFNRKILLCDQAKQNGFSSVRKFHPHFLSFCHSCHLRGNDSKTKKQTKLQQPLLGKRNTTLITNHKMIQ